MTTNGKGIRKTFYVTMVEGGFLGKSGEVTNSYDTVALTDSTSAAAERISVGTS